MNTYQKQKVKARQKAIKWQNEHSNKSQSYDELIVVQRYFERLARRFGLVSEFQENGII